MSRDEKNGKNLIKRYDLVNFHLPIRAQNGGRKKGRKREKALLKLTCDIAFDRRIRSECNTASYI